MHILRVVTVYEPEVSALPRELRSVLTRQDAAAIRTGAKHFAKLGSADSPKWLRKVLAKCAQSDYELQFHSSGDAPYRPYFRFSWEGQPAISLPRAGRLRVDMPNFLRHLYGVVGALRENDFDMAGGLVPGDELRPLSETDIRVERGGSIDPTMTVPFLQTFSGSLLCYLPDGSGTWMESCEFRRVKNLEREVGRYFEALLKGARI